MKRIILICLIFIPTIIYSQKPIIENINLNVKNNDIVISYDILYIQDSTKNIDLILIDKSKNVYIPENIYGNIGTNLETGKNKLSFNMINQSFPLDRELAPALILNHNIKKGPNAALLSVIMPGLGDYFVENPKNMKIKPYYRTTAVGAIVILAVMAFNNRPEPILSEETYLKNTKRYSSEPDNWIWVTETLELPNPHDYWLFRNDMEIFIGAAASIWVFDIFWVLTKGQQNQKIKSALKNNNYNFALSSNGFSLQVNLD